MPHSPKRLTAQVAPQSSEGDVGSRGCVLCLLSCTSKKVSRSALTPNTFWVDLKSLDFSAQTGKVMKLDLGTDQSHTFSGNATQDFKPAKPFQFLGI